MENTNQDQVRLERETMKSVARNLAQQFLDCINQSEDDNLVWTGTKTNLMELVNYIYDYKMMTDEFGVPLTKTRIAQIVCRKFNVAMPRNLSTYRTNILNNKGLKSTTLLNMAIYSKFHNNTEFLISRFIRASNSNN